MEIDSNVLNSIASIMDAIFIIFFFVAIIGLAVAALTGFRRGVYKSTYKFLGLALLIVLALVTIKPFMNLVLKTDLTGALPETISFTVDIGSNHIEISATTGTVESTLTDLVSSFCTQINASQYVDNVNRFIKTLVVSIVSFGIYIVDIILIAGVGNGILELLWALIFKRATPKIVDRIGKIRAIGVVETIVTYLVLLFLFVSPLTSITNSINQAVQKSKVKESENETVKEVIKLVDIYNDSLFARTFFNWNSSLNKEGLTFDTFVIDYFTNIANDGVDTFMLSKEINNLVGSLCGVATYLGENDANGLPSVKITEELIGSVFDIFGKSDFFAGLFEISMQLALNSTILEGILPNGQYFEPSDLKDFSLEEEIETLKSIGSDIVQSGIIDDFVNLDTYAFEPPSNLVDYLDDLFTNDSNKDKLQKIINTFRKIDDFKVLDAAIQSLGYWGITMDSSLTVLKYLGGNTEIENPYDNVENKTLIKEFIDDVHIGKEINMIFDSLWGLASCGDHVIKYAFEAFGNTDEDVKTNAKAKLINTLKNEDTLNSFRNAICGTDHMNEDGTSKERDNSKGEHYALLDSEIVTKFINKSGFLKNIFNITKLGSSFGDASEDIKTNWNNLMTEVYSDSAAEKPIKFFKTEINNILNVVTNIASLEEPYIPVGTLAPSMLFKEPTEKFEYKEYSCLLEAIVNLFDGWIDADDVVGSFLKMDSRIAPYISGVVRCLKPLDNSKIVTAVGLPLITSKMSEVKESTKDLFDIDICIDQIKTCGNVFEQLSNFLNKDMVTVLQHFYKGFLTNSEGKFDLDVLTNMITDMNSFLDKLNEKIVLIDDDPATAENEEVIDTQPMKVYFAEFLKGFYNFEIFNPHSGANKNKNMENVLNYVFGYMNSFGIESPSAETYATLDTPAKWESELDAITNLLAVIGKDKVINIASYSSNLSSALLYSLGGDLESAALQPDYSSDMPKNIGEVFHAIGDSKLFSSTMGGLLDSFLDGSLCDSTIDVQYKNIKTQEQWHEEAGTISDLLNSIAKLDLDLTSLDLTKVSDFIAMNDMLHKLSDSLIFKSQSGNKYGEWLFSKVNTALNSFSAGLLNDPESSYWDSSWDSVVNSVDNTKYPSQKIAYYDFLIRDGFEPSDYEQNKLSWSESDYESRISNFKNTNNYASLSKTEANELYKQPGFMTDYYDEVLKYDETGRVVNVIASGIKAMNGSSSIDFANLSVETFEDILTSINNTNCLRIASYNAVKLAKDSFGSNDLIDASKIDFEYLVTAGESITEYNLARENRQVEISHFVNFYNDLCELQKIAGSSLSSAEFFNKTNLMNILGIKSDGSDDESKKDLLTEIMVEMESSRCFNLQKVENRIGTELSCFEDVMVSLMDKSGLLLLTDTTKTDMENRARKISNCEFDAIENTDGYNSSWVKFNGSNELIGGEIYSLTKVMKNVVGSLEGPTIDAGSISITSFEPTTVKNIMKSINDSYLCTGVIKHFVKSAFTGSLGLDSLLKYDSADTEMLANFDLTYQDYGGTENNCDSGTEIDNIYRVLDAMEYRDSDDNIAFISLNDLQDSINKKPDCLNNIFYFLYNSRILSKSAEKNGELVRGRSVLLYNALKSGFESYLIGNQKEVKVGAIEKIFLETSSIDNNYLIEANGITRVINEMGNSISSISLDDLKNDDTLKDKILNVFEYTYNRDTTPLNSEDDVVTKKTAYFTSEIIAGVLDSVLDEEYSTISTNGLDSLCDDYQKFYFASNSSNEKATQVSDVTLDTFNNFNLTEKRGLEGMLDMVNYVDFDAHGSTITINPSDLSGTYASIMSNPLIDGFKSHLPEIEEIFDDYLYNAVENKDSRFAKILFISRAASSIKEETTDYNDTNIAQSGDFVLARYVKKLINGDLEAKPSNSTWSGFREDFYSSSFNFAIYGSSLMNYIEECVS